MLDVDCDGIIVLSYDPLTYLHYNIHFHLYYWQHMGICFQHFSALNEGIRGERQVKFDYGSNLTKCTGITAPVGVLTKYCQRLQNVYQQEASLCNLTCTLKLNYIGTDAHWV